MRPQSRDRARNSGGWPLRLWTKRWAGHATAPGWQQRRGADPRAHRKRTDPCRRQPGHMRRWGVSRLRFIIPETEATRKAQAILPL